MLILSLIFILSALISSILMGGALILSEKSKKEREKMTPFECGFSPYKKSRSSFSLRFFLITLLFLIFDMEVAMVLPMGIMECGGELMNWAITSMSIIFILTAGLIHEWKNGALSWV